MKLKKILVLTMVASMTMSTIPVTASEQDINTNIDINTKEVLDTKVDTDVNSDAKLNDINEDTEVEAKADGSTNENDGIMVVNIGEDEENSNLYYSNINDCYAALVAYCGIPNGDQFNATQADLIIVFQNTWANELYKATSKEEADATLVRAKAAWAEVMEKVNDKDAMDEHAKLIAARDESANARNLVMDTLIKDATYTNASRDTYERRAREILTKIQNAESFDVLNAENANFDALRPILVKISEDILDARDAAKDEVSKYNVDELESCVGASSYYKQIDALETKEEINAAVISIKGKMLEELNANIKPYINAKIEKSSSYAQQLMSTLGNKANELASYYRENYSDLLNAKSKSEVDEAYAKLIQKLDNKAKELSGTDTKPEEGAITFADVPENAWYHSYVQYVASHGLMKGYEGEFTPNGTMTRAMLVETLYRMSGKPEVKGYGAYSRFSDLSMSDWYSVSVAWALNEGIATGDPVANKFNPDASVTREQLAAFLYRYAQYTGKDVALSSSEDAILGDTSVQDWARTEFAWVVDKGLISGIQKTDGAGNVTYDLAPRGTATRAQLAAILQRYCENIQ